MIAVDRSPKRPRTVWCKYCNSFVVNNEKCVKSHNESVVHKVNTKNYQTSKYKERITKESEEAKIDEQLTVIQARAQEQYLVNDVLKSKDKTLLDEHLEQEDNFNIAKELYGEELAEELLDNCEKLNKVEVYNDFMKSLPAKIPKKFRKQIAKLKE